VRNRDDLAAELTETLRTASAAHWAAVLQDAGVPCSPIRTLDEVVADPQVEHLRLLRTIEHPKIEQYRDIALPLQVDGQRVETRLVPPDLGADTREILEMLGHTPEEVAKLLEEEIVSAPPAQP
jgi:formyl-CoA transferase